MSKPFVLFDFSKESNIQNWIVVNDGVMGGLSKGYFSINDNGDGLFRGNVSLENNGGFSSVRYNFESKSVTDFKKITLRLKGDGKRYQIRVKTMVSDYYSYIAYVETNGEWQTVEIPFTEMIPSFRGYKLDLPNYPGEYMEQFAILIGNKKREDFELYLDKIIIE
ncbi:CIA30 family protein [uncultured Eudoraea sp.]|uniref:CIA30 family protein n=1 Tax=uncultured Eudoraea sp. TaxID=1035614 RepID=UPI00261F786E|nr:CIA30 family protein [uncultured Eudoraea sp.]